VDDYTDEIKFVVVLFLLHHPPAPPLLLLLLLIIIWQVCLKCFIVFYIQMLASASDPHLGGRDIDLILAEHFSTDFQSRYRIDPRSNPRAFLRLTAEVEKLKKQMSANSTTLPVNIECFMDDKDVHGDMKRYGNVQFVNCVPANDGSCRGKYSYVHVHAHMTSNLMFFNLETGSCKVPLGSLFQFVYIGHQVV
jgi:hypothetical protein